MNSNDHDVLKQRFAKLVCDRKIWLNSAKRLVGVAKLMLPEVHNRWDSVLSESLTAKIYDDNLEPHDFQSVFLMIVAYALENIMKAYYLNEHKESILLSIAQSGILPKALRTHDLVSLAKECHIGINSMESSQLTRLSKHGIWVGRYNFPLNFKDFYHLTPQNRIPSSGRAYRSDEPEQIARFFNSLAKRLGFEKLSI